MAERGRRIPELVLRCLDAAVTAPARTRRSDAPPLRALLRGQRSFDRIPAALNLADALVPGLAAAVSRRLIDLRPLALAATAIEFLDFGSGGTIFRLETPAGPRALKVFRRSLGRPLAEQLAMAAFYTERYRTVAGWYAAVPGLVATSAFGVLPGPILGRPVTAAVQPFVSGRKRCFLTDLDLSERLDLLRSNPEISEQFHGFARATLACWTSGGRCFDLVGRENLMLVDSGGRTRLSIVDCGVFDLAVLRREAPERYAALGERIGRLESILARAADPA